MKLQKIIDIVKNKYPEYLQYSWDNSGLNIGNQDNDIKKIMTTLEVTQETVDEAIEKNVDLIISHHPFLFSKINKITKNDIKGNLIYKLIKNDISVYCMHTNFDVALDGLNDYFLKIIEIENKGILDVIGKEESYLNGVEYGLGRIGILNQKMSAEDLVNIIKNKLNVSKVRFIGDLEKDVKNIAVVTGAGAEYFKMTKEMNIDILITGDMKYHQAMDALEIGACVMDLGHFETEYIFADSIMEFLKKNIDNVEVIKTNNLINPFTII